MVKIVLKNSYFVHRVMCGVHVDRSSEHMLGWGQRIAICNTDWSWIILWVVAYFKGIKLMQITKYQ